MSTQPHTHSGKHWNGNVMSLLWRHNGSDGVSNHQPHNCLLNRSFRRRSKKPPNHRVTGLCAGNSPVTDEFLHKWPITRKMFPFDDVVVLRKFPLLVASEVFNITNSGTKISQNIRHRCIQLHTDAYTYSLNLSAQTQKSSKLPKCKEIKGGSVLYHWYGTFCWYISCFVPARTGLYFADWWFCVCVIKQGSNKDAVCLI